MLLDHSDRLGSAVGLALACRLRFNRTYPGDIWKTHAKFFYFNTLQINLKIFRLTDLVYYHSALTVNSFMKSECYAECYPTDATYLSSHLKHLKNVRGFVPNRAD